MNRFWSGYLLALCLHSIYQDLLGKDKYIALVSEYWVDATYSIPVAIVGVAIAVAAYLLDGRKQASIHGPKLQGDRR